MTPSGLYRDAEVLPKEALQATSATYDEIAAAYAARADVSSALRAHVDRFVEAVVPRGWVLDVGSEPGQLAAVLTAQHLRTIALDSSIEMLRLAAGHVPVVRGDLRRLPVLDASLDGVWSCATLLHVPRPEVPATLASWHRALRPGGVLGLSTAVGEDDEQGWEVVPYAPQALGYGAPLRRWFVYHSAVRLQALLTRAGFELVHVDTRTSHRTWLQVVAVWTPVKGEVTGQRDRCAHGPG